MATDVTCHFDGWEWFSGHLLDVRFPAFFSLVSTHFVPCFMPWHLFSWIWYMYLLFRSTTYIFIFFPESNLNWKNNISCTKSRCFHGQMKIELLRALSQARWMFCCQVTFEREDVASAKRFNQLREIFFKVSISSKRFSGIAAVCVGRIQDGIPSEETRASWMRK